MSDLSVKKFQSVTISPANSLGSKPTSIVFHVCVCMVPQHHIYTAVTVSATSKILPFAAKRIKEQLKLIGITSSALSRDAQSTLQLLANVADSLKVRSTKPSILLAAWSQACLREFESKSQQVGSLDSARNEPANVIL